MEYKEPLTNEQIKKKFKNQFELVGYSIKLAENMIKSGRSSYVKTETQNPAMQILAEIYCGKDQFVDIPSKQDDFNGQSHRDAHDEGSGPVKTNERKKTPKI